MSQSNACARNGKNKNQPVRQNTRSTLVYRRDDRFGNLPRVLAERVIEKVKAKRFRLKKISETVENGVDDATRLKLNQEAIELIRDLNRIQSGLRAAYANPEAFGLPQ